MSFVPFISDVDLKNLSADELKVLENRIDFELTHARQRVTDLDETLTKIRAEIERRG